jgi:hypothetical protein
MKRTPMKRTAWKPKPGKHYKRLRAQPTEWDEWRPYLREQFIQAGIDSCEIRLKGCWGKRTPQFAHVDKRRWCTRLELFVSVVWACGPCHNTVEAWGRQKMRPFIQAIIDRRGWMPSPPPSEEEKMSDLMTVDEFKATMANAVAAQAKTEKLKELLSKAAVLAQKTEAGFQVVVTSQEPEVARELFLMLLDTQEESRGKEQKETQHARGESGVAPTAPTLMDKLPFE